MAYLVNREAPMSGLSNLLALKGRKGDTELIHMSKPEVNVLERMGKLSVNPRTGLPEAFRLNEKIQSIGDMSLEENSESAMQQLINYGRNKLEKLNVISTPNEGLQQIMPKPPLEMRQPMPPQPMPNQGGLSAMLAEGGQGKSGYFEGMVEGEGDGMDDTVDFKVEGDPIIKRAKLSNEEYVMPADSVAILGNGSSDAGAEKLDDFIKYIRSKAFGTTEQQNEINASKELKGLV
tara:strand:- start:429 stop:1130 length:702 start_codon:yes stop_codon:yes gene_type:complete